MSLTSTSCQVAVYTTSFDKRRQNLTPPFEWVDHAKNGFNPLDANSLSIRVGVSTAALSPSIKLRQLAAISPGSKEMAASGSIEAQPFLFPIPLEALAATRVVAALELGGNSATPIAVASTPPLSKTGFVSFMGEMNPLMGGRVSIPFVSTSNAIPLFPMGSVVGFLTLEVVVTTPLSHPLAHIPPRESFSWPSASAVVVGHRGLGMNLANRKLQLGENTIASFAQALKMGVAFVEFDAQVSKDGRVLLYHDSLMNETGFPVQLNDLTEAQFLALKPSHGVCADPQLGNPSPNLRRSASVGSIPAVAQTPSARETQSRAKIPWKGNFLGCIQEPFTTLKIALETLPMSLGFNVEIKYPLPDEVEMESLKTMECNKFVDAIIETVLQYGKDRHIVFSSFNAEAARMTKLKQSRYPVLFLTMGGKHETMDPRLNSVLAAARFAKLNNLDGIVSDATPILQDLSLIEQAKEIMGPGKLVVTYGGLNCVPGNAKKLESAGLNGIIVDAVRQVLEDTRLEQVALKHAVAPAREDRQKLSALAETLSAQLHTPMKLEAANECIHNTLVSPQSFACAKCAAEFPPSITIRAQAKAVDDALRRAKRCVAEYADKQLTSAQDLTHLSTRIQTLSAKSHAQTQASNALKAACVLETAKVLDLVEKRLAVLGERDALVEEIEDRTQELFEKANGLVADEAKRRYVSQTRVRTLESELEDLEGQLAMEKMQSSELRAKMEELRQLKEAAEAEKAAETATDAAEAELAVENADSEARSEENAIKSVLDAVSASLSESPQRESPEGTGAEDSAGADAEGPTPVPSARLRSASASAILLTAPPVPAIEPDAQLLQDLQSFIKECGVTKLTKLHTLPFLKTCLEEDVLPCLKFGGNPRTATRKLVDAILVNSCFLEEMNASQIEAVQSYHNSLKEALDAQTAHNTNPNKSNSPSKNSPTMSLQQANTVLHAAVASMNQTATHQLFQRTVLQALWTTASSSSSATTPLPASIVLYGCPACGCTPAVTRHHFKISDSNTDKWIPICIHCRGRLLAVCEFYNFVRHLKLGLYSTRAESDIYAEVIGLRGRMWEARCGGGFSVPSSALAAGAGVNGVIGGMASKGKNSLRPDSVLFDGLDVGV
ncbi:hypothetical protein CcCBS67573_g01058 [Chytriomyces confervae]|uniref:GP-PDE domain-containing protein n=1 Tax=Chytriomyces confervae TaxID=246404 RepID=A0A507FML0_9FUNG|nr:Glycerophosphocholine phosphodiesterase [Chytriomyces hyalinus]TPX77661.1 hypothetical protein CcCBS67573_g01058 [Chytriomyces confervae]